MNIPQEVTPKRILEFAWGYAPTLIIEAAIRHGVFDVLERKPGTLEQLSAETGTSERGLKAILNVLVSVNLLERDGNKYTLSPESAAFLVTSKPAYHGMFFGHISDQLLPKWLD